MEHSAMSLRESGADQENSKTPPHEVAQTIPQSANNSGFWGDFASGVWYGLGKARVDGYTQLVDHVKGATPEETPGSSADESYGHWIGKLVGTGLEVGALQLAMRTHPVVSALGTIAFGLDTPTNEDRDNPYWYNKLWDTAAIWGVGKMASSAGRGALGLPKYYGTPVESIGHADFYEKNLLGLRTSLTQVLPDGRVVRQGFFGGVSGIDELTARGQLTSMLEEAGGPTLHTGFRSLERPLAFRMDNTIQPGQVLFSGAFPRI
jgi:hypothetical protein